MGASFPAALLIPDARIVPFSPVTQDLMMDYRDRDDLVWDAVSPLELGHAAGSDALHATLWYPNATITPGLATVYDLIDEEYVNIPPNIKEVYWHCFISQSAWITGRARIYVGAFTGGWVDVSGAGGGVGAWFKLPLAAPPTGFAEVRLQIEQTAGVAAVWTCHERAILGGFA